MKSLLILAALTALTAARPETYKENEDFEYSRSSTDEGSKAGFYAAQRGNMGGNYERAHNMDGLAQHQMNGLVTQVEGELGDGFKTRRGNVYSSANSRGMYGSGHYDFSKLGGRNFEEGTSHLDSDSHRSALAMNSAYRGHSGLNSRYNSDYAQGMNRNQQSLGHTGDSASHSENMQASNEARTESRRSESHQSGYYSQAGYHGQSYHNDADADQRIEHNYSPQLKNRLVSVVPVRVHVRPGGRVAVPVGVQTYHDVSSSASNHAVSSQEHTASLYDQSAVSHDSNSINTEADDLRVSHNKPSSMPKSYESSYRYRKQWEKHDTEPLVLSIPATTTNPLSEQREHFEDNLESQMSEHYRHNTKTSNSYRNSNQRSDRAEYNTKSQRSAFGSQDYRKSENSLQSGINLKDLESNSNDKPSRYQSSYSYHKSWERQGDPYVIKPIPTHSSNSPTSEQLRSASHTQDMSHHYGSHQSHHQGSSLGGDEECEDDQHIRVARSNRRNNQEQLSQNLEDLGQQSQNQWDSLDNLGQQTQQEWKQYREQGNWENARELREKQANEWRTAKENLRQNTNKHRRDVPESQQQLDLGQQTQDIWQNFGNDQQLESFVDSSKNLRNEWENWQYLQQNFKNQWSSMDQHQETQAMNTWGNDQQRETLNQHNWQSLENRGETQSQHDSRYPATTDKYNSRNQNTYYSHTSNLDNTGYNQNIHITSSTQSTTNLNNVWDKISNLGGDFTNQQNIGMYNKDYEFQNRHYNNSLTSGTALETNNKEHSMTEFNSTSDINKSKSTTESYTNNILNKGRGDIESEDETSYSTTEEIFSLDRNNKKPFKTAEEIEALSLHKEPESIRTDEHNLSVLGLKHENQSSSINAFENQSEEISKINNITKNLQDSDFDLLSTDQQQQSQNIWPEYSENSQNDKNIISVFDQETENISQQRQNIWSEYSRNSQNDKNKFSVFDQESENISLQNQNIRPEYSRNPLNKENESSVFDQQSENFSQQSQNIWPEGGDKFQSIEQKQNVENIGNFNSGQHYFKESGQNIEDLTQQHIPHDNHLQEKFYQHPEDLQQQSQNLWEVDIDEQRQNGWPEGMEKFSDQHTTDFVQQTEDLQQNQYLRPKHEQNNFDQTAFREPVNSEFLEQSLINNNVHSLNSAVTSKPESVTFKRSEGEQIVQQIKYDQQGNWAEGKETQPAINQKYISENLQHQTSTDNANDITTEKPGFWKSVSNKFVSAKDKVSSWFSRSK